MWTNGEDVDDNNGDPVRLYQPILYASGRKFSQEDPTVSYIGGTNKNMESGYCAICHNPLEQLVQLHVPTRQQSYSVSGCNRASCVNQLFSADKKFSCGGGGVFYCQKSDSTSTGNSDIPLNSSAGAVNESDKTQQQPTTTKKPPQDSTNEWAVDSDEDNDDDLEQQVAAMELKQSSTLPKTTNSKSSNHKKKKKPTAGDEASSSTALPCFELHSVLEPPSKKQHRQGDDDDDDEDFIGTATSGSDAKIQQMLAKYMAEEEDPEILAALQQEGATGGNNGGASKSREKDERLKAADRALLAFTDRIKRSPRQVLRYAPNGIPMWSIPPPQAVTNKNNNKKGKKAKQKNQQPPQPPIVIPPCSCCGTQRRFEFQLMPSLLHVLEVDQFAQQHQEEQPNNNINLDTIMSADYGGMNWGVIAVYTCPKNDCKNNQQEEFVVVQASVDETPMKRAVAPADAPVFIKEDQTFDALTNDGDLLDGDEEEDDDDETVVEDENNLVFTMDG